MKMESGSNSPSTVVNESAKNPHGQASTMQGAAGGVHNPPNQDLHSSKNIAIEPGSGLGAKVAK